MRALSLIAFEKNSNNPDTQEMMRFAEEFRQAGGKTGWLKRGTMEELRAEIREVTGEVSASSTYKDSMVGLLKTAGKYSGVSPYMSFMDKLADVSDNGVRLAVFAELRRKGVPVKRAAYHAKELTVNFSKTGEIGPALNQAFLFFNTAVVGNARFARAVLRSPYVRAAAGAFAAAGVTAAMISMAMSGDDEDGEDRWTKIPDYEKERYAILMYGPETTDVIKIPLPWSFAFTYTAGTYLAEFFAGNRDASDTVFGIVRAAVSNFSPFQLGKYDGPVTQATLAPTPTLLKPGVENLMNENFMGSPITPRRFPGDFTPNSEVAMRKTAPAYREVAEALNDVTGGERGVSGALDLYPDHIRHTFEFLIGGTGKFVTRTGGTIMDVAAGEELDESRIPFVRQIAGVATVGSSQIYYDRVEEVMQRGDVALEYARSSGSEAEYRKENRNWIDLAKKAKETESRLRTFRQQRKVAEGSTKADRKEKIKEAEDKMDAAFIEFNRSNKAQMRQ